MDKLKARKLLATSASKNDYIVQLRDGGKNQDEIRILNSSRKIIAVGTVRKDSTGYDSADVQGTINQIRAGNFEVKPRSMNSSRRYTTRRGLNSSHIPSGFEKYYDFVSVNTLRSKEDWVKDFCISMKKEGYGVVAGFLNAKPEYEDQLFNDSLDFLTVLKDGTVGQSYGGSGGSSPFSFYKVSVDQIIEVCDGSDLDSCVGVNCSRRRLRKTNSSYRRRNRGRRLNASLDDMTNRVMDVWSGVCNGNLNMFMNEYDEEYTWFEENFMADAYDYAISQYPGFDIDPSTQAGRGTTYLTVNGKEVGKVDVQEELIEALDTLCQEGDYQGAVTEFVTNFYGYYATNASKRTARKPGSKKMNSSSNRHPFNRKTNASSNAGKRVLGMKRTSANASKRKLNSSSGIVYKYYDSASKSEAAKYMGISEKELDKRLSEAYRNGSGVGKSFYIAKPDYEDSLDRAGIGVMIVNDIGNSCYLTEVNRNKKTWWLDEDSFSSKLQKAMGI